MNLQASIFESILKQFKKKSEAVKALSDLLNIGENAIYRRIRGESILTPEEIQLLAKQFHLSLDNLIHQKSDKVLVTYPPIAASIKDFTSYLDSITQNMQPLIEYPNGHIKYAAAEIPLFHYCFIPELIAFKLYTWGKTTWNFDYLKNRPFQLDLIAPSAYVAATNMLGTYLKIKSTELWNLNVLDNTLNQIEYYTVSGSIPKIIDAFLLCDKMVVLVQHLKQMAELGKKFPLGSKAIDNRPAFQLFHNEMVYTNNTILVSTAIGKGVFSTVGNPNYIKITDQRLTDYIENWFDGIMNKSQPISKHAEKARNQYFNRLLQKIEATKNRLTLL